MWRLIFWDEESRTGNSGNGHRPDEPQIFLQILPKFHFPVQFTFGHNFELMGNIYGYGAKERH
jgi:hypothetical protein